MKRKLIIAMIIVSFVSFCGVGTILYFSHQEKQVGLLINIAGRQRMLSQRMSKNTFILKAQESTSDDNLTAIDELNGAINLFDTTNQRIRFKPSLMILLQ